MPEVTVDKPVDKSSISVLLLDSPDVVSVFGYHLEDALGKPVARCFVDPVLDNNGGILNGGHSDVSFASIVSHEIIETFIDPDINLWVDVNLLHETENYSSIALEIADPVQGVLVPVKTTNITVELSNFVFPSWFDNDAQPSQYDYAKAVSKPLQVLDGGYIIGRTNGPGSEKEIFSSKNMINRHSFRKSRRLKWQISMK